MPDMGGERDRDRDGSDREEERGEDVHRFVPASPLRGRGAAGWRSVGGDDHHPRLDGQAEAAVSAGRDAGLADDIASRAADEQGGLSASQRS